MIVERRFFLRGGAALGAAALGGLSLPTGLVGAVAEEAPFEPDPSGYYVACGFEDDGRLYLSEIVNNRSIQRIVVAPQSIGDVVAFLDQAGLPRAQFVNWHASMNGEIEVRELELPWSDGQLPASFAEAVKEAVAWLSIPAAAAATAGSLLGRYLSASGERMQAASEQERETGDDGFDSRTPEV